MGHIELVVDGMTSRDAVRGVTARLGDVVGVLKVTTDAAHPIVRVYGRMSEVDLMAAFVGTGYAPQRVPRHAREAASLAGSGL